MGGAVVRLSASTNIKATLLKQERWWVMQLYADDERYGYTADAGNQRTLSTKFRDRERKLMRSSIPKYVLLPGVDLYAPIDLTMLKTWVPGS